jgi:hypothetical protein
MVKKEESAQPVYCIRVQGNIDPRWSNWLQDMSIASESNEEGCPSTVLRGPVADQAALRGVLTRLWDLNLDIISVTRIERQREEA